MAEKERPDEGPSLEMPSLGSLFKRGRKKSEPRGAASDPASGPSSSSPAADPAPSAEDFERLVRGGIAEDATDAAPREDPGVVTGTGPAAHPATASAAESLSRPATESAAEPAAASPSKPATESAAERAAEPGTEPAAKAATESTQVVPDLPEHDLIAAEEEADLADLEEDEVATPEWKDEGTPEPAGSTAVDRGPTAPSRATGRVAPPPAADQGSTDVQPPTTDRGSAAASLSGADAATAAATPPGAGSGSESTAPAATTRTARPQAPAAVEDDLEEEDQVEERRTLVGFELPTLPAAVAAAVTGAIVGVLAVGLTYFGLQGCEAVKGTSACGGPGIPILIAIMVILVVVGSALLGAWRVTDPTSTSFLAVGLLAVIALLFLIEVIFSPAMAVVIPLVSVGTYSLSQWVTARFIEDE